MKTVPLLLMLLIVSCSNTGETKQQTDQQTIYKVLSIVDFKAKMESLNNYQLCDVRTAEEVAGGTIGNAVNIDYKSADFEELLGKLDRNQPLLLFCRGGTRSAKVAKIAIRMGFVEIYDLEGGFQCGLNRISQ